MLPEDLKNEIAKGPTESELHHPFAIAMYARRIAELAYQRGIERGREDERKQRADQEKANLDLAEAIDAARRKDAA